MANPVLQNFKFARATVVESSRSMTVTGSINKTGILLTILVLSAMFSWHYADAPVGGMLAIIGVVGSILSAIALTFRPIWAPVAAPTYAVLEGLAVGYITYLYDQGAPGIAVNAVILTLLILGLMLTLYRFGILRATPVFRQTIFFATMGIGLLYMVNLVMMAFHAPIGFIHNGSPYGIIFSFVVAGIAAFNLIMDFDFIEKGEATRAPLYLEWYAGFGLLVTLVWLYLEILRLLSKGRRR